MKVLQINTIYKKKSTGRTCWEVEKALENAGHESITFSQLGEMSDTRHSYQINTRLEYLFHKFMARITGLDGYYSYFATKRAIKKIVEYEPDIIHLRNLHGGYIHLPSLFSFLSTLNIPIVYNIHDTWAYTGKCPAYDDIKCEKWKSECGDCPQWKRYPNSWFLDRSRKIFNDKKNWCSSMKNLTVVAVSDYIKDEVTKSVIFKGRRVERIYNWIDLDVFHPYDNSTNLETRNRYDLGKGFLVIGVSSFWKKNTEHEEICEIAKELGNEGTICLVGGYNVSTPYENMIHIPNTDSMEELAKLYSCADVFVSTSTAEAFGKVAAEAMACGTPEIVYDSTGIKEIPGEGSGHVVKKHDLNCMKNILLKIKADGKEKYSARCRARAEKLFDYDINSRQLLELYREVLTDNNIFQISKVGIEGSTNNDSVQEK